MSAITVELSYTLDTIDQAVQFFWQQLHGYYVFAFSGDMGAGKTTFIHHLCSHLGVEDTVSSPTFALINEYHFTQSGKDRTIYHLDWYRLAGAEEAINAGMEDCIQHAVRREAICFIEWPAKAKELMPSSYVDIRIESTDPDTRKMTVMLAGKGS